ncbi:1-hydroxycarotenoid 3,4-desaturase CrtD [Sphingomonas sp. 37zxx]|uniref:1-hydroxycarotenoid 3,4-desaturase CrtD n=1 Tax=Sphingomonas sp. 37zxx TaxID=1550073 RepID=UPI00068FDC62|nr:1-hydroxycarotenoid 3,4-desaturase CrtD [Sphingomonas sp. 37zxx]
MTRATRHVVVVGAGMGGLAAAADLAHAGVAVTVIERAQACGGKMRQIMAGGRPVDAGPTVFTMRWIFEGLFTDAGERLEDHLELIAAQTLARHAWRSGGTLDLFADIEQSADAIGAFAGADEARGYLAFCARGKDIYTTLAKNFIASERPSVPGLVARLGLARLPDLWRTMPMRTLWSALGDHFKDPRLRQLFGRYATYVGASPWSAPATLMLIAHVEQNGVWLVKGGTHRVAQAIQSLAQRQGAQFRFGVQMDRIVIENGRVAGVLLDNGERLDADAVVYNGDISALTAEERPVPATSPAARSLSAVTWCLSARTAGFDLAHHNVFFAEDYADEFKSIFRDRRITSAPTVYMCAQDRGEGSAHPEGAPERMLALISAPADGDRTPLDESAIADLTARAFGLMEACGLKIETGDDPTVTTPTGFEALFPASGGALYGRANHGMMGSFARAGASGKVPGLYLAGGSVHPGPGIPMATMSGRIAAARLLADWAGGPNRRRTISIPVGASF